MLVGKSGVSVWRLFDGLLPLALPLVLAGSDMLFLCVVKV